MDKDEKFVSDLIAAHEFYKLMEQANNDSFAEEPTRMPVNNLVARDEALHLDMCLKIYRLKCGQSSENK